MLGTVPVLRSGMKNAASRPGQGPNKNEQAIRVLPKSPAR
jgi:hypothetical protein